MTYNDRIFRHKKHPIGDYKDVRVCPKVSDSLKEKTKSILSEKWVYNSKNHEASMVNLVDDAEVEVNMPTGPSSKCQRNFQLVEVAHPPQAISRCPPNHYLTPKTQWKRKGGPIDLEASRKILGGQAVSTFAR